jgi:terminase small subunit / prophage DNA-packing protein
MTKEKPKTRRRGPVEIDERIERAKYYRAKAEQVDSANRLKAGTLVEPDVIVKILERPIGEIAAALDALPAQIKKDIPHLRAGEIDLIRKRLARCRNALARIEIDNPTPT